MEMEIQESFDVFKNFIRLLKTINEEMTLTVTEEGITAKAMDPSHVAMIQASMKPELVDSFVAPKETETICANLNELNKFLDRIGKDEKVKIHYEVENARLAINASKGGHRRRFLLPVLEPLEDEIPEPKILFKASGRILTQAMRRAIRDANLVSENIKLEISEDAFKLSATGDTGSAYSEWKKDSDELLELKAEEEVTATYTLRYLTSMFNALNPLCDVVIIESSTDMPCRIKADGVPHIEVDLYLAPCIGV